MTVEDVSQQRRRQALRQVASGVAVLTFWYRDDAHGTTVSAVTAVSRDPLLVAVCLRRDSVFARLVAGGQRFGINVLSAQQARLASWFADPQRPPGLAQFDYLDWEPDTFSGAPLITGSLARLGCRLTDWIDAGDHHLLLAEVMSGAPGDGTPLLSFAGQLHDGLLRSLPARQAHPAARTTTFSAANHT